MTGWVWFHKNVGRVETEKILLDSKEDGSFLIRESDTVKGAYVLSTIYQRRIHHYRILPNEDGKYSVQAQQGIQRKAFDTLDEMVEYYKQAKRGIVCGLTRPIAQQREEEPQEEPDDSDDEDEVSREKNLISRFLSASLSTVDTSKVDDAFRERIKSYLNNDVAKDVESMATPAPTLNHLKQLFSDDCLSLHQELNVLMARIDLLQSLFERAGGAKHSGDVSTLARRRRSKSEDTDYDSLGFKLNECAESAHNLETTAFQMLRELSVTLAGRPAHSNSGSLSQPPAAALSTSVTGGGESPDQDADDEEVMFDVKIEQGLSVKKSQSLVVSLRDCKLRLCKPGESHGTTYDHQQILQLIKSRSKEQRLGVLLSGQNRKDYIFNSMRAREHFCQLIQLIRNRERSDEEHDHITVFVGTWNMGDAGPPSDISSWLRCIGLGKTLPTQLEHAHDMYVIGTQETDLGEKEWVAKLKLTLKTLYSIEYEKVASQSLWGIRCLILVKPEHSNKIAHIQYSQVRTGIGNALGNKGGVGISFYFGSLSLCFVNCHLTSGIEKCGRRNNNYHDILKGMGALKHKTLSQFDLTNQFTHLFFLGDLNYRIDQLGATEIVEYAKKFDHYSIYSDDQLKREKDKKKVFVGFDESPILFPPTYRFAKGTRTLDDYVWVKQKRSGIRINVPSYCDRVLWRSYPGAHIINTSYGCTNDIMTSDHSPVFSTFQVMGIKQYTAATVAPSALMPSGNQNAWIVIDSINARIQTNSKTYFYIEVHSTCFEGLRKTPPNNEWAPAQDSDAHVRPVWCSRDSVIRIAPIIKEQGYLEQQHLLLLIKSQESDEPYAECCVSLRELIGQVPVGVRRELIHQGIAVGELDSLMHVTLDQYKQKNTEDELYSDVNFIMQEEASAGTSLDLVSNGSKTRPRNTQSESDPPIMTAKYRRDSVGARPMLPIPRTMSHSHSDRHRVGSSTTPTESANGGAVASSLPAPPLPRRRDGATSPRQTASNPSSKQEFLPPAVPARRSDNTSRGNLSSEVHSDRSTTTTETASAPQPVARPRNHPVPARRKIPPSHRPEPLQTSPPLRGKLAQEFELPPLPPKSPPLPPKSNVRPPPHYGLTERGPPRSPPIPRRHGGGPKPTQRPPSTVESLLMQNGMQHFLNLLVTNGYDDVQFLAEVPEDELQEIGISQPGDRAKLLRVFKQAAQPP